MEKISIKQTFPFSLRQEERKKVEKLFAQYTEKSFNNGWNSMEKKLKSWCNDFFASEAGLSGNKNSRSVLLLWKRQTFISFLSLSYVGIIWNLRRKTHTNCTDPQVRLFVVCGNTEIYFHKQFNIGQTWNWSQRGEIVEIVLWDSIYNHPEGLKFLTQVKIIINFQIWMKLKKKWKIEFVNFYSSL